MTRKNVDQFHQLSKTKCNRISTLLLPDKMIFKVKYALCWHCIFIHIYYIGSSDSNVNWILFGSSKCVLDCQGACVYLCVCVCLTVSLYIYTYLSMPMEVSYPCMLTVILIMSCMGICKLCICNISTQNHLSTFSYALVSIPSPLSSTFSSCISHHYRRLWHRQHHLPYNRLLYAWRH